MKIIAMLLLLISFTVPAVFADSAQCQQALAAAGLQPHCDSETCELMRDTPMFHSMCANASGGENTPYQAVVCKNQQNGELKSAAPSQIIQTCMELSKQDPDWQLSNCYCCC